MFVKVTGLWDNDDRVRAAVEEFIAEPAFLSSTVWY